MTGKKRVSPQKFTTGYLEKVQLRHSQERDSWANNIGHIVLIFTEIEDLLRGAIERFGRELFDFSSTLLLEKRMELLATIISGHIDLDDQVELEFNAAIKRIAKLAVTRNLIVHNSLRLVIVTDATRTVLSGGGVISSARNKAKTLDLAQLVAFLDELKTCYIKLDEVRNRANKQWFDAFDVRRRRERRKLSAAARRERAASGTGVSGGREQKAEGQVWQTDTV